MWVFLTRRETKLHKPSSYVQKFAGRPGGRPVACQHLEVLHELQRFAASPSDEHLFSVLETPHVPGIHLLSELLKVQILQPQSPVVDRVVVFRTHEWSV